MIKLAFCNDCDLQTWEGYRSVHATLDGMGIPAGDSFWLFDPSGRDMGLFRRDCTEKGPRHDEILEEVRAGRIDVFHSAGQYSSRFGGGLRPDRKSIGQAIEYLAKHARIPRVWTNHGDELCVDNIAGSSAPRYRCGDDPASDCYILDLFLDAGVKYFWTDERLIVHPGTPARLVAPELTRSGHTIQVFTRFMGVMPWAPNAQNFQLQLNDDNLNHWLANDQNIIIYQHWGCHHDENRWAFAPDGHPLTEESVRALEWLNSKRTEGKIEVVRLADLLDEEASKAPIVEIDRIARIYSRDRVSDADQHYYVQFHTHTAPYFQSRIDHLNPRGQRALDAGCGVGQWSLCLTERFDEVVGFDSSADAISLGQRIAQAARVNIDFSVRDIYASGYPDDHFDFAICYGVIFLVQSIPALKELYRVLKPGASCFLSVNGDGWYQYLVEDRLKDRADEERQLYVEALCNAYVARCGGVRSLRARSRLLERLKRVLNSRDREALVELLPTLALDENRKQVAETIQRFSDYTLFALANTILKRVGWASPPKKQADITLEEYVKQRLRPVRAWLRNRLRGTSGEQALDTTDIPLYNRPYGPEEFGRIAQSVGFTNFRWGRDASLSLDSDGEESQIRPLHDLYFQGNLRVWECIITKPVMPASSRDSEKQ